MHTPRATYRIQFHAAFPFAAARDIVPYLKDLGVSDLYASPVFRARSGSNHGYDVVDPNEFNPELGGDAEFYKLSDQVRAAGMGWIQDIVPNHMAFSGQNSALMNVLENGPDSPYHDFFDIIWDHPYESIRGTVLAPFLGSFYGECLEKGEIKLTYDRDGLSVQYYAHRFPLAIHSYPTVLTRRLTQLRQSLGGKHPDFVKYLGLITFIKNLPEEQQGQERRVLVTFIKDILWDMYMTNPEVHAFIDRSLADLNGNPEDPQSFDELDALLNKQYFRLVYWKAGTEELNYRRFFTVNDLISLRMEDPRVFRGTHELTLRMLREGRFQGLRVDHIDGLYDPSAYLHRLREAAPDAYLVVEKILESDENPPQDWPIQGTTGYEFLNTLNGIFVDRENAPTFTRLYRNFTELTASYQDLVLDKKRLMIGFHMAGDVDNLAHLLKGVAARYRYGNDLTLYALRRSLVEIMALFPVYRTYMHAEGIREEDATLFRRVIEAAKHNLPQRTKELDFIQRLILRENSQQLSAEELHNIAHLGMRLQQFTGPLMAKGVEDTVFYIYNRLLSLNEVGGNPSRFGIGRANAFRLLQDRALQWPHVMNGSSTHDTKRGEDVRARLNVLSEIPEEWEGAIGSFRDINEQHRTLANHRDIPDPNDEYLFYQTVLGSFPATGTIDAEYVERLKEYMIKAAREAKMNTSWQNPDEEYESGLARFVESSLGTGGENDFLLELRPLLRKVIRYGIYNSLSQLMLKIASPGVPDFYQGSEFWDLSLVDPDNRRPVDYQARRQALAEIRQRPQEGSMAVLRDLLNRRNDGRIKMFVMYQGLRARKTFEELFRDGDFLPLKAEGPRSRHVVTFARSTDSEAAVVVVPRFLTSLCPPDRDPFGEEIWQDTRVPLPDELHGLKWKGIMVPGRALRDTDGCLFVRDLISGFPVSLLVAKRTPLT